VVSTALPTDVPELVDWQLAARVGRTRLIDNVIL